MSMTNAAPRRGRPRDPGLEGRVLAAALAEYARTGWAAFTIDGVARRAGVGKSALYLRWPAKADVLLAAVEAHSRPLATVDTGSLRGDALELATRLLEHFLDPVGWVTLRLAVDAAAAAPELDRFYDRIVTMHRDAATAMVGRAVDRGELPADVVVSTFINTLYGSVLMCTLGMRATDHDHARAHAAEYVTPLVDLVLAGSRAAAPTS